MISTTTETVSCIQIPHRLTAHPTVCKRAALPMEWIVLIHSTKVVLNRLAPDVRLAISPA
jgi:hypothetical protein